MLRKNQKSMEDKDNRSAQVAYCIYLYCSVCNYQLVEVGASYQLDYSGRSSVERFYVSHLWTWNT